MPLYILLFVATSIFCACSAEVDTRGAERLQFCYTTPPNIKSDFEIILGNLEAAKYRDIRGPVRRIRQKNYLIAKDENGKFREPHFSGTVEMHFLPTGELSDFSSYDSVGTLTTFAQVLRKTNRHEIYMHLFESNRDFVYALSNEGRILEEGDNPFYRQSPVDHSWNSVDGHFSWEENAKHQIVAASGISPGGPYRHLYSYDENDSLTRIVALNSEGTRVGSIERNLENGKLQSVEFRYDERLFYPKVLNFTEEYRYDSLGRISKILTSRSKAWESQNDTVSYAYRDSAGLLEQIAYRKREIESRKLFDSEGTAVLLETYGTFIYEGLAGTSDAYDVERFVREVEYENFSGKEDSLETPEKRNAAVSLSADEFFRSNPASEKLLCRAAGSKVSCARLVGIPGPVFLNFVESVSYKNPSEVFLLQQAVPRVRPVLLLDGKCAALFEGGTSNGLLFENASVSFRRDPFSSFVRDSVTFSRSEFPCDF